MILLEMLSDDTPIARNFQTLKSAVIDTGGISLGLRCGNGTWTWPGGQTASSVTTVPHGLGVIPKVVHVTANQDQGASEVASGEAFNKTATTFQTRGVFKTATPGAGAVATFDWTAIG